MNAPHDNPSEKTSGLRSVLSLAPAYRLAQRAIGADRFRAVLVDEILRPDVHDRVLDLGCGTADILEHLPAVDYVGFDPSQRYVDDAADRFGERGTFVTELPADLAGDRTLVTAIGVFHHMDDDTVRGSLAAARRALSPGGRFVSVDPALTDDQHPVARWLISHDRGQHVRTPAALASLVHEYFPSATVDVRHDLLRTPYTHVIVQTTA